ncbi:DUF2156 domain-containing protein [Synechococcus sp. CS-1324]|uniref:phosphatidylglycerol lysyltransferase domain-containing protein n=1 Tax=Synechococcus sp. CS-1324 TaxID=2847980 RepID=UPI00223C1120|nr:phosphatidylglycerol lysyltransferase domain-containing protein [Synechococcus sp. CS-1324]MCT0230710.1 DUF2156 domain-containing protein [Synechococcus sp. CS-1324]
MNQHPRRPWITAGLMAAMGIVNLLSAVSPSLPARLEWWRQLVPFELRHTAHLFAALCGFFLLVLASALLRRKRMAWLLALALLGLSIVFNIIKGFDYEESLLAALLIVLLIASRGLYTARSDPPSIAQGARSLLASILFTLAYGTAGFLLLNGAFSRRFSLPAAAGQTLRVFVLQDSGGVRPLTRFAAFFTDSIQLIGFITLMYGLWMLLRPIILRGEPATAEQRQCAHSIVEGHARSSLAPFALLADKAYCFSPSGKSLIAYVPKGRGAIALGDPIGPPEDRLQAIEDFQRICRLNDWIPGFYQTGPEGLELFASLGFSSLKIGEEALVDLSSFSTSGKAGSDFRTASNRLNKLGHRFDVLAPPHPPGLLRELKSISDEWLRLMHGAEKRFSVGWFEEAYLQRCPVMAARDSSGRITAFATVVPDCPVDEISIDLMRHRQEMVPGTMDALFVFLFHHYKDQGVERFSLGLSALSGVGERSSSPRIERAIHYLSSHMDQFYGFEGLRAYKAKFKPRWEPRYLVFAGYANLMATVVALIRADSGDRLVDYFKPEI